MRKIFLYLDSLEKREKIVLIFALYIILIIVGLFFVIFPLLSEIQKLDRIIYKEKQNYRKLLELASEYKQLKQENFSNELSLTFIENLAQKLGIKENITYIKPYQEKGVEVYFENIKGDEFIKFIKKIKEKEFYISFINIESLYGGKNMNAKLVIQY